MHLSVWASFICLYYLVRQHCTFNGMKCEKKKGKKGFFNMKEKEVDKVMFTAEQQT